MWVPVAPVDLDDFPQAREHHIRRTGESADVQPVAVAHSMNEAAHEHLGRRILAPDAPHVLASPLWWESIRNRPAPALRSHPMKTSHRRTYTAAPWFCDTCPITDTRQQPGCTGRFQAAASIPPVKHRSCQLEQTGPATLDVTTSGRWVPSDDCPGRAWITAS